MANAVQAGSVGSLHIGGAAQENHLRESYRAAHATFLAIAKAASDITWRVVGSNRRQVETLTALCSSLDGLVSDFDLFAPAEVRAAFHWARFAAQLILTDAHLTLGVVGSLPGLSLAIDNHGNVKRVAAMNKATAGFVEAVRTSVR
ncbi:hypothetical protein OG401_35845 [Kitasatospora purpeofusca]|uniref:hypothetical protein n=1 Tax=Kitasatospora purpeofusca TaxID=67352 RepID=UPI00225653FD|nr:hypothetical protein [Kitasatospora purpeofusca]MCX4689606.1 hypothetical protein [Kitasatospora purpeofusca]